MKLICFKKDEKIMYGSLEHNEISVIEGSIFESYTVTDERLSLEEVEVCSPCKPGKAICVGLNYREHVMEFGKTIPSSPVLFMKPSSSIIAHGESIIIPQMSKRVDFEAELVIVIGKEAKAISEDDATKYILGYTCGNDVTARDLQPTDGQWTIAKSFDTFLPLGPWIETDFDASNLEIKSFLNGKLMQHSNTRNMIFTMPHLVSFISHIMTLYPGDIIMTGTPCGVGPMKSGDKIEVVIEKIGTLVNYVR